MFVGEGREDAFIGLHNWIQFYLQEKTGNIDYHGYFRRETVRFFTFKKMEINYVAYNTSSGQQNVDLSF